LSIFGLKTNISTEPALPYETLERGQTFSHIFGLNTALFEQFVLARNIMGPCWLKVEEPNFSNVKNVSTVIIGIQSSKYLQTFRHLGVKSKPTLRNHR